MVRPIALVDKCIVELQTAMNDVGEFVQEKSKLTTSFEASQTARAEFQVAQLVLLRDEIRASEMNGNKFRFIFTLTLKATFCFVF